MKLQITFDADCHSSLPEVAPLSVITTHEQSLGQHMAWNQ